MKRRVNKKNLIVMLLFVLSMSIVVNDIFYLFLNIDKTVGFTLLGSITFVVAVIVAQLSLDYLEDKIKRES